MSKNEFLTSGQLKEDRLKDREARLYEGTGLRD